VPREFLYSYECRLLLLVIVVISFFDDIRAKPSQKTSCLFSHVNRLAQGSDSVVLCLHSARSVKSVF